MFSASLERWQLFMYVEAKPQKGFLSSYTYYMQMLSSAHWNAINYSHMAW